MEPITLGFLLAAAVSGVVGNKADKAIDLAVGKSLQAFTNRRQHGDESVYRELQKATCRSFLLAQQSLASECLKELTTGRMQFDYAVLPGHEADVRWLEQKLKRIEKELKQVEQGKTVEVPIALGEIQPLLTPEGALAVNSMQAVREKLIAAVRDEGTVPYYQSKVEDSQAGLFEQMRRHFASEILHNAVLNNFFQGQLLTQINANLQEVQAQQINVRDWENALQDLARHVSQDILEIKDWVKQIASFQNRQLPVPDDFRWIIEDKTKGFVGREFVFEAIEELFHQQRKGYFIIEGDPGMGKSSILAEFVRRNDCIVYFNQRNEGITSAEQFLRSVCIQLIEGYGLSNSKDIQPENTRNSNFLSQLLNEVSGTLKSGERLVIAVDALDEVDLSSQSAGANVLYLPGVLPDGVYFIVTKRPLPPDQLPLQVKDKWLFDLMQYPARNQEDVEAYIRQRITSVGTTHVSPLQEWVKSRGANEEEFVSTLVEKSEGNFMYLRYVLDDIEKGAYPDLEIRDLPSDLQDYYYKHWERMGMNAKPLFKIKIVYILSESPVPIPFEEIVAILEADGEEERGLAVKVQAILDEWMQFLREEEKYGQTFYSLYHSSFRDFLRNERTVKRSGITLQGIIEMMANSR